MRTLTAAVLLFAVIVSSMPLLQIKSAHAASTIFVPTDYATIQEAINNAAEGDTIFVYNDVYSENVVLNKTVSLIGENKTLTIINGGAVGPVVVVTANNVTMDGFTVINGSYSESGGGILLRKVQYANVSDNVINSCYFGVGLLNASSNSVFTNDFSSCSVSVFLNVSHYNTISNNVIANSISGGIVLNQSSYNILDGNKLGDGGFRGISLSGSPRNSIIDNEITGFENGLGLENSGENTLVENDIKLNEYNLLVSGTSLLEYIQNASTTNKIGGRSLYYFINKNGFSLNGSMSQDVGYLAVVNSSNINAADLNLFNNGEGFLSAFSSSCTIRNSTLTHNLRAGLVYYSPNITIINSTFSNNEEGISFSSSPNSIVRENSLSNTSGIGLKFASSGGSLVENNLVAYSDGGGLNFYSSSNCTARRNVLLGNSLGILVQVSSNVRIADNLITESGGDAIYFSSSDNCVAQNNNVSYNAGYGIIFQIAQASTVIGNRVWNSSQAGISLYSCNFSLVNSNFGEYNEAGISMQFSLNSQVLKNEMRRNVHEGILVANSPGNIILDNRASNNSWDGIAVQTSANCALERNVALGNAHFGIWIQSSRNVRTVGCEAYQNLWDGVYISGSDDSRILNSTLTENGDAGCRVYSCKNVTLSYNNVTRNKDGIRIFLADNNNVSNNKITENVVYGINIYNSTGNKIYNNLMNNTQNVNVLNVTSTAWDDGYPNGGNFWSDYAGTDAKRGPSQDLPGSDGIGDTPRVLDSENRDKYPIIVPFRFHNVVIETASIPSNEVYVGWVLDITVTIKNSGGYVETFNITAKYNGTSIGTIAIHNLTVGDSRNSILKWNTSGLSPYSLYDVKAEISPILGEISAEDNIYDFGIVRLKMVGDVNNDRKVNILDIAAVATGFGARQGEPRYKLMYDMNLDYVVNIVDISAAAKNYGKLF